MHSGGLAPVPQFPACRAAGSRASHLSLRRGPNAPFRNPIVYAHSESDTDAAAPDVGWLWEPSLARTRGALNSIKARPKKALGQNFISDAKLLQRVVKKGLVAEGDMVIEIGPGTGNLTQQLLKAGATVLAVEKDYALAERLESEVTTGDSKFEILQGDILRLRMPELISKVKQLHGCTDSDRRVRIVANLPYYITTDLLKQLLPMGDTIESLLLLLQDEVALRLTSEHPDGAAYRPMTVLTHYYATPKYHFRIDRSKFFPMPSVHGAVASFALRRSSERQSVQNEKEFTMFVRQAFLSKRKLLTNSLQPHWQRETITAALQQVGLPESVRPAEISSSMYVDVYNAVCAAEQGRIAHEAA